MRETAVECVAGLLFLGPTLHTGFESAKLTDSVRVAGLLEGIHGVAHRPAAAAEGENEDDGELDLEDFSSHELGYRRVAVPVAWQIPLRNRVVKPIEQVTEPAASAKASAPWDSASS